MLASTTALSQFFRSSTSVIGPELIRDLALSSEALGFANSAFFMAVFLSQIPVGIAFDRFGVRLTVAVLSVPMAAGAMLHGIADSHARRLSVLAADARRSARLGAGIDAGDGAEGRGAAGPPAGTHNPRHNPGVLPVH